uniref:Putative cell growth/differentiation regulator n=1 Tax=Triatoma infestans TaxID=30076 RepID=A0A023F1E9_TRIIF
MELKVWVEGIQRIVCGVTEATTCQDVVYALAHATGKTGRFTLIERWRNNERLLAPQEHPLKVVTKWGEYSSEVQLILQRSGGWGGGSSGTGTTPPPINPLNSVGGSGSNSSEVSSIERQENCDFLSTSMSNSTQSQSSRRNCGATSLLQVTSGNQRRPPYTASQTNNKKEKGDITVNQIPSTKLVGSTATENKNSVLKGYNGPRDETVVYNAQYRDLVRLVNYQREKLSAQQAELTKFDAEIVFWEGKTREQQHQIEFMSKEAAKFELVANNNEQMLRALCCVEEEREIVEKEERTLRSELTLLRSKLVSCEAELLQYKKKIKELNDELDTETKGEPSLLAEVEKLQRDVDQARTRAQLTTHSSDVLHSQVKSLESAIADKKRQVERLVAEMKEANLQSLAAAPSDELKLLLEGPHKPGSVRRMIGSPRQLENAVPTSKNPHGVWV